MANLEKKTQMMFYAIQSRSLELLKALIKSGADIDTCLDHGVTPFLFACQQGELELAKYLIKEGAQLQARCDKGWSALTYAALNRSLPLVQFTLQEGCDPTTRDIKGMTPLHAVVAKPIATPEEENVICTIIDYLVDQGVSIPEGDPAPSQIAIANGLHCATKRLQPTANPSLFGCPTTLTFPQQVTTAGYQKQPQEPSSSFEVC